MFESLKNFSNRKAQEIVEEAEVQSLSDDGIKVGLGINGTTSVTITHNNTKMSIFLDKEDVKRLVKMLEATM